MLKKTLPAKGSKENKLLYLNSKLHKGLRKGYFIDGTKSKPKHSTVKSVPNTEVVQKPSCDWESRVNVKIRYPNQSSSDEAAAKFGVSSFFASVSSTTLSTVSSLEIMPKPQRSAILPVQNDVDEVEAQEPIQNDASQVETQKPVVKSNELIEIKALVLPERSRSQSPPTKIVEKLSSSKSLERSKSSITPPTKIVEKLSSSKSLERSKSSITPPTKIVKKLSSSKSLERSKSSITAIELEVGNENGFCSKTLMKSKSVSYKITERSLLDMGYKEKFKEDWPDKNSSEKPDLFQTLRHIIESNIRPNFTVYIGDSQFSCHLIVLQIYSEFFQEITNDFAIFIPAEKVSFQSFEIIYKWMISDEMLLTRENVLSIYLAAKFLRVNVLIEQCWKLFGDDRLFVEYTAFLLYVEAQIKDIVEIKKLMESRIYKFFLTLVASKEFLLLPLEDVKTFLSSNTIGVNSEMEVFFIAIRWLNSNWKDRKKFTEDIMSCVRFQLIPCWFLITLEKVQMGLEVNRVIDTFDFKKIFKDCLTYATAMSHFKGQIERVQEFLGPIDLGPAKQRYWIFDPYCSHHHNIDCPGMRLFTYKTFLAYLLTLQKRNKGYWETLQELDPKKKQCCQSCEFKKNSMTVKNKEVGMQNVNNTKPKNMETEPPLKKGCSQQKSKEYSKDTCQVQRLDSKKFSPKELRKHISMSIDSYTKENCSKSSEELMEHNCFAVVTTFDKQTISPKVNQQVFDSEIDTPSIENTQRTVVEESTFIKETACSGTIDVLEKSKHTQLAIDEQPKCESVQTLQQESRGCLRNNIAKCSAYDKIAEETACLLRKVERSRNHQKHLAIDDSDIDSSIEESSMSSLNEGSTDSSTYTDELTKFQRCTDEKLLVIGGHDPVLKSTDSISDHHGNSGNHVLYYDHNAHMWRHLTHIPFGPRKHFSTVKCNGKVYVLGGTLYKRDNENLDANVWSFDPHLVKWALETSMPEPRKDFAAVAVDGIETQFKDDIRIQGRGIFVIGGQDMQSRILDTVWYFDVIRKVWEEKCPLVTPRYGLMAIVINNEILAAGGVTQMCIQADSDDSQTEDESNETSSFNHLVITNSVEIFRLDTQHYTPKEVNGNFKYSEDSDNVEVGKWVLVKSRLRVPRLFGRFCLCAGSILFLSGGIIKQRRQSLKTLASIDCFNFETKEWFHVHDMDCTRHGHDMVEYKDALVIVGGVSSIGSNCRALSEVFIYDYKSDVVLSNIRALPWPISGAGIVVISK